MIKIQGTKNYFYIIFLKIFIFFNLLMYQVKSLSNTYQSQTLVKQLEEQNIKIFATKELCPDPSTLEEFIDITVESIINPSEQRKQSLAFEFYKNIDYGNTEYNSCFIDTKPLEELEFFKSKNDNNQSLANIINRTQSEIGRIALLKLIAHPISNTKIIRQRQNIIKTFVGDRQMFTQLSELLTLFKNHEGPLLSWWDKNSLNQVSQSCYFVNSIAKSLNNYSIALDAISLYDRGWRLVAGSKTALASAILILYGVFKLFDKSPDHLTEQANRLRPGGFILRNLWKLDNNIVKGITSIIAGIICGSCSHEYFKRLKTHIILERAIHKIMGKIAYAIDIIKECKDIISKHPQLKDVTEFSNLIMFFDMLDQQNSDINEFITHLESDELHGDPSSFWLHGSTLRAYKLADKVKSQIAPLLESIGQLDAFISIAQLYKDFESCKNRFSFVEFEEEAKAPNLEIKNVWHPLIDYKIATPHSLSLGEKLNHRNAIISGPDNSGKSTVLKEVAIAVIMAQSLGIAPAQTMRITPFDTIETNFDGYKSQNFKSSEDKIKTFLNHIKKQKNQNFHFIVCDKPFCFSSPLQAEELSHSLALNLGNQQNCISLMTTHFGQVTNIAQKNNSFINLKISNNKKTNQCFNLENGISYQDIIFCNKNAPNLL